MTIVCVNCKLFFKAYKNGQYVEEGMPLGHGHPPTEWASYKLWACDRLKCQGCGAEILAGFSQRPIAEHYQAEYAATRDRLPVVFRIDDCPGAYRKPDAVDPVPRESTS